MRLMFAAGVLALAVLYASGCGGGLDATPLAASGGGHAIALPATNPARVELDSVDDVTSIEARTVITRTRSRTSE